MKKNLKALLLVNFMILSLGFISREKLYYDRELLHHKLIQVYGASKEKKLQSLILDNPSVYSGPCSIPGAIYYKEDGKIKVENPLLDCKKSPHNSKLPLTGKHSRVREAWNHKVCQTLSFSEKSLNFALQQAGLNRQSSQNVESLRHAYKLFTPIKNDHRIIALFKNIKNNDQIGWPEIFYVFCMDHTWQTI